MNKSEFISKVAEKGNMTKLAAGEAVNAMMDVIEEAMKSNEKIQLPGFGTFEQTTRAAREMRNPQTGAMQMVPESKSCKFKPGKTLKDAINGK